jgi:dephospho-CoA kinase
VRDDTKIYLIAGKARNGKSTLAKLIKEEYEHQMKHTAIIQYPQPLKEYAVRFFGWDGKEETKPRELLDNLGDIIRNKLHKTYFFINRLSEDIEILSYLFDVIIVDDARLRIEVEEQRKRFGSNTVFIKMERDDFDNGLTEKEKSHITETDLDNYNNFDYIIKNNGTIEELEKQAKNLVEREGA